MADYHPLVARAVAELDNNTGEARRALYERARTALVTRLRSVTPVLSESEITRERLALEEAIRKVEAEEARRGRRRERPPAMIKPPLYSDAVSPEAPSVPTGTEETATEEKEPASEPAAQTEKEPPVSNNSAAHGASSAAEAPAESTPLPRMAPESVAAESRCDGIPLIVTPHEDAAHRRPAPAEDQLPDLDRSLSSSVADAHLVERREPQALASDADEASLNEALRKLRGRFASGQRDVVPSWPRGGPPDQRKTESIESAEEPVDREPPTYASVDTMASVDARGSEDDNGEPYAEYPVQRPPRRWSGALVKMVAALVVLALLGTLAAVGYRERGRLVALYDLFRSPPPQTAREEPRQQPKIEDRVGSTQPDRLPGGEQRGATGPLTQPPPAVAQRVVLYEEDAANPSGRRYVGSVIWRTETVSPGPGLAPELAVKADIEIPERRIAMTFSMVRNTDQTLPASHTIDVRFSLPPGFSGGGVANVPGILMKQAEQTRGVPLAGIAVKVTDNVFLIGLSSVDSDVQRNTQLLRERSWFDIPIVYSNGSRAILAMEKGTPGERAFSDAFTAWGRTDAATR